MRPDDGLERMTKASAAERRSLLRRGAGPARDPLTVGQLSRHVLNLVKLQIQLLRFWRENLDNFYRARVVHFVANGPDANRVAAGLQPGSREAIASSFIARDGHGDGRARFLRGDEHTLHGAFLRGGYLAS